MVDAQMLTSKPIKIYNTMDGFIFQKDKKIVSYNKSTKTSQEQGESYVPSGTSKCIDVYSILGFIEAEKLGYLIAADTVSFAGRFLLSKVYKIDSFVYLPSEGSVISEVDKKYLQMLDDFLKRNPLFYSDTYDLTVNYKNLQRPIDATSRSYIFPYTNSNFCWNYFLAKSFDMKGMESFIYPVINGFFTSTSLYEYNDEVCYALIGRKDHRRGGMRFLTRGSDANGNIANFAETEEILIFKDTSSGKQNIISYLEVRGSIPMLWTQEPSFQLNPKILPKDDAIANTNVFKIHMNELVNNYGAVAIINLIDKKKDQKIIGDYYQTLCCNYKDTNKNEKVDFVWFDFHAECKKMKYENLSRLLKANSVSKGLNTFGYTHITFDASKLLADDQFNSLLNSNEVQFISKQSGVFRTNCIDSLDRTNVVQSVLARFTLHKILNDIKMAPIPNGEPFQKLKPVFEDVFKKFWADHGDHISLAYSGTGALKADFVRTGKRTSMGNLVDGYLSSKRFFLNNFVDGYNQDCLEYFIGQINPRKCIFKQHSLQNLKVLLPVTILLAITVYYYLMKISMPAVYEDNFFKKIYRFIVFITTMVLAFKMIFGTMKKSLIDVHTRHA